MKKHMFKRVAVASATAGLLITMSAPAFAAGVSADTSSRNRTNISRETDRHGGGQRLGKKQKGAILQVCHGEVCRNVATADREATRVLRTALKAARKERDAAFSQAKSIPDQFVARIVRQAAVADYRLACQEALHRSRA